MRIMLLIAVKEPIIVPTKIGRIFFFSISSCSYMETDKIAVAGPKKAAMMEPPM
jgi:hypothetical protein